MGDGRTHVRSVSQYEAVVDRRRREEVRTRLCMELLESSPGTTREEILTSCGIDDAEAFLLLSDAPLPVPTDVGSHPRERFKREGPLESFGTEAESLSGFRWVPGMRIMGLARVLTTDARLPGSIGWLGSEGGWSPELPRVLDVDDEGTAGCLLSLLGRVSARPVDGGFVVTVHDDVTGVVSYIGEGSTLGRACVSAARAAGGWK